MFPTGLEFAVETLKSFILAMALIDNHLTVEKAVSLSRLELEFQVWRSFLFVKEFTFDICSSLQGKIEVVSTERNSLLCLRHMQSTRTI